MSGLPVWTWLHCWSLLYHKVQKNRVTQGWKRVTSPCEMVFSHGKMRKLERRKQNDIGLKILILPSDLHGSKMKPPGPSQLTEVREKPNRRNPLCALQCYYSFCCQSEETSLLLMPLEVSQLGLLLQWTLSLYCRLPKASPSLHSATTDIQFNKVLCTIQKWDQIVLTSRELMFGWNSNCLNLYIMACYCHLHYWAMQFKRRRPKEAEDKKLTFCILEDFSLAGIGLLVLRGHKLASDVLLPHQLHPKRSPFVTSEFVVCYEPRCSKSVWLENSCSTFLVPIKTLIETHPWPVGSSVINVSYCPYVNLIPSISR